MKALLEVIKTHKKASFVGALILLASILYFGWSVKSYFHSRSIEKQDAQIHKSIDQNAKSAEGSEANANTHRDARQSAEGRAGLANEQREQARANSNLTVEPVRKARQKHEEARKSRPADYPAMSDDELCAELARRQIPCR